MTLHDVYRASCSPLTFPEWLERRKDLPSPAPSQHGGSTRPSSPLKAQGEGTPEPTEYSAFWRSDG
jgi:hypothetical protein